MLDSAPFKQYQIEKEIELRKGAAEPRVEEEDAELCNKSENT